MDGGKSNVTTPWRSLIGGMAHAAEFAACASIAQISLAERSIGVAFPDSLRTLLMECDGVRDNLGAELIWPCAKLVQQNAKFRRHAPFRELYMPFDNLLLIGEDGGGDQFAFAITADGQISKADIYRWEHETDGRPWFAGGLRQYLERLLSPQQFERR